MAVSTTIKGGKEPSKGLELSHAIVIAGFIVHTDLESATWGRI